MEQLELWFGFAGAWLLFAGPIYQAALELREQDIQRDLIAATSHSLDVPPRVSRWWWLMPPLHYFMQRRQSARHRAALVDALPPQQVDELLLFVQKATGWMYVAFGGLLIASSETWTLFDHNEWPVAVYWVLVLAMIILSGLNVALRMARDERLRRHSQAPRT